MAVKIVRGIFVLACIVMGVIWAGYVVDALNQRFQGEITEMPWLILGGISGCAIAAVVFGVTALLSGIGFLIYRAMEKKRALREAGDRIASQTLFVPPEEESSEPQENSGKAV